MIPILRELARTDTLSVTCALVGRFYGDGLLWALALPLHDLIRWRKLMPRVMECEPPMRVTK